MNKKTGRFGGPYSFRQDAPQQDSVLELRTAQRQRRKRMMIKNVEECVCLRTEMVEYGGKY